ncbi:MAG: NifB/NifX family molybdenum-iron cluster-binding protein [Candidatus Omnitrophica bacterium]|nr:NifB/NifX family molybdenum-iron cluster-binding protein [Candidatus Omnitrophota bacterium]
MKIAIATDGEEVSMHFGRCPSFTLIEVENGKVLKKEVVDNPGHHPGFLPRFMHEQGVRIVIAGGAGRRAQDLFSEVGIELVLGASGPVEDVIRSFVAGELKNGESSCQPRSGKGYGIDKTSCDHAHSEND